MKWSIGRANTIRMQMLCPEGLVVKDANGARNGESQRKRPAWHTQTDGAIEANIKVSQADLLKEITSPVTVEHSPCNTRPTAMCNTVKLEPVWTRKYLHEQHAADHDLKVMLHLKQTKCDRPPWEEVSPYSRVVKVLWAQWERLEIHDQVLCRRWEEENGSKLPYTYQIILPVTLQKIAFDGPP